MKEQVFELSRFGRNYPAKLHFKSTKPQCYALCSKLCALGPLRFAHKWFLKYCS